MIEWFNPAMATQARELIAETLFVFDIGLLVFIALHLRREVAEKGFLKMRRELGNQAAMAVGVHISGLTIIRGWATLQYVLRDWGYDTGAAENAYPVALFGLVVAMLGMACCIRIFSPVRYGHYGWVLVFMAAIGFVGFVHAQ